MNFLIFFIIIVIGIFESLAQNQFKNYELLKPWYHEHERSYQMPPFNLWVGTSSHNGVPYMIQNRITGREFIVCLHPQAGSTPFKFLFRASSTKRKDEWTMTDILSESPHSKHMGRTPEIQRAFMKPHVPRIMIVRNPYVRFLSAYLSSILHQQDQSVAAKDFHLGESFESFADKLVKHHADPEKIDFQNPFKLQSRNCLLSDGMSYDYYLPIEQIDFWYEALMDSLDVTEFTKEGWNASTPLFEGNPNQPCFYRAFNRSCDEMFTLIDYTTIKQLGTPPPPPSSSISSGDLESSTNKNKKSKSSRSPRRTTRRHLRSESSRRLKSSSKSVSKQQQTIPTESLPQVNEKIDVMQRLINNLQQQLDELKALTNNPGSSSSATTSTVYDPNTHHLHVHHHSHNHNHQLGVDGTDPTANLSPTTADHSSLTNAFDMNKLNPPYELLQQYAGYYNESNLHLTNYYRYYYYQTLQLLKKYYTEPTYSHPVSGTIERFDEFFNTDSVVELLTSWMLPDLKEFNYPIWYRNNMTSQEYLYSLFIDMPRIQLERV